jgi:serine-type D-Ala-D-Ala carboxypeptidase/endopeptidase (penicillin-binding protein 4)
VVAFTLAVTLSCGLLTVPYAAGAPSDVQPSPADPATPVDEAPQVPVIEPAADPAQPPTGAPIARLLARRLHDPRLGRSIGVLVIDAETGAVLFARHPDGPLHAASNMKLVTALTSLATMGPNRRFGTSVLQGRRPGHVILRGGGDPLLSRGGLRTLAARTAESLGRTGRVIVHSDATLFASPGRAPGWLDHYLGNSVGRVQPLAMRGDRSRQPARNAAAVFVSALRERGVDARLARPGRAADGAPVLGRIRGHTVAEAVAVMLRLSESSVAEVLYRQVALAVGRTPTWAGSQRAAREALIGLGIDPGAALLADGSGLSVDDRLSPRLLTQVLRVARTTEPERFEAMFRTRAMPISGRTGTLTTAYGRYNTSPSRCARGLVQAKTGTIYGTIALSGVADTRQGGRRLFSIIVNDRPQGYTPLATRQAVDGLAATITGCWD